MSVSSISSHGAVYSVRKLLTSWLRPVEMFGPDWYARTVSTGTGPLTTRSRTEAANSARTVPPCTYPATTSGIAFQVRHPAVIPDLNRQAEQSLNCRRLKTRHPERPRTAVIQAAHLIEPFRVHHPARSLSLRWRHRVKLLIDVKPQFLSKPGPRVILHVRHAVSCR